MFWRNRNVLVTGSTGFLGGWVVRALKEAGACVVGLERDRASRPVVHAEARPDFVVRGSVEEFDVVLRTLNEYEVETVLHLAAQAIVGVANRNPMSTFDSNIRGTWTLLEACRLVPTVRRIVIASSDKAYGSAEAMPYVETLPMQGRDPYAVSKSCADLVAQCYHATYGTPVCITRCANFFGGGDLNYSRIVPGTVRSALQGERPVLRSDGKMIRDYIYVRDVAEGYLALAARMDDPTIAGEAFNFSLERPMSVLEITRLVLDLMGRGDLEPVVLDQASGEIPVQYLSADKVRRAIGWRAARTLEDGLRETIAWYRDHLGDGPVSVAATGSRRQA